MVTILGSLISTSIDFLFRNFVLFRQKNLKEFISGLILVVIIFHDLAKLILIISAINNILL